MRKRTDVLTPTLIVRNHEETHRPDPMRVLLLLTENVTSFYKHDPSAPSIVLSKIGPEKFYAAVVRYKERYGEGKFGVVTVTCTTQEIAIVDLAREWFVKTGRNAAMLLAEPTGK